MGQQVMAILDVDKASFEEKHLGLSVPEVRMKDGRFKQLKKNKRKE
jgi:hypothetical protein